MVIIWLDRILVILFYLQLNLLYIYLVMVDNIELLVFDQNYIVVLQLFIKYRVVGYKHMFLNYQDHLVYIVVSSIYC